MNCRDIERELSAFIDGEVTDAARTEIDAHVASCPHCYEKLAELKKLSGGVARIPKPQPAQQFLTAVRRKIAAGDVPERMTWADVLFRPAWLKLPIEAVALIAILVAVTILMRPTSRPVVSEQALAKKDEEQTVNRGRVFSEAQAPSAAAAAAPVAANAPAPATKALGEPSASAGKLAAHGKTESNGGVEAAQVENEEAKERLSLAQSPGITAGSALGYGLKSAPGEWPQRQAAPTDNALILTAGQSVVVLNFYGPSAVMTVKSDDAALVRDRAQAVAALLNGRVIVTERAKDGLRNVYVVLPGAAVEAFKSQFAAAETLTGLRQEHSSGLVARRSIIADGVVAQLKVAPDKVGSTDMVDSVHFGAKPTATVSGAVGGFSSSTAGNGDSNVVLEIQVIPSNQ